jgi:transketolase
LIFTRQGLPQQDRNAEQLANVARGGYVLKDCEGTPDVILIATGSEVQLAVEAFERLTENGNKVRVVSMPSTDVFDLQDEGYKIIGMDTFGESAPAGELFKLFGITTDAVVEAAESLIA